MKGKHSWEQRLDQRPNTATKTNYIDVNINANKNKIKINKNKANEKGKQRNNFSKFTVAVEFVFKNK